MQMRQYRVGSPVVHHSVENPPKKKKLNAYERSLLEKAELREKFFQRYLDEQREMYLYPGHNPKSIIVYPLSSGLGNNLGVLAEGILISMMTHRRLMSNDSHHSSKLVYRWDSFYPYFHLPLANYSYLPVGESPFWV